VRWLHSSAVAAATAAELELPWGVMMAVQYLTQAVAVPETLQPAGTAVGWLGRSLLAPTAPWPVDWSLAAVK
jgi:hydroxymethylpyrimidine/phosphomethylpyrimidine kinase